MNTTHIALIIIALAVVYILIKLRELSDKINKEGFGSGGALNSLSNEAIQNIASVYNSGDLTVSNLHITGGLTVDNDINCHGNMTSNDITSSGNVTIGQQKDIIFRGWNNENNARMGLRGGGTTDGHGNDLNNRLSVGYSSSDEKEHNMTWWDHGGKCTNTKNLMAYGDFSTDGGITVGTQRDIIFKGWTGQANGRIGIRGGGDYNNNLTLGYNSDNSKIKDMIVLSPSGNSEVHISNGLYVKDQWLKAA